MLDLDLDLDLDYRLTLEHVTDVRTGKKIVLRYPWYSVEKKSCDKLNILINEELRLTTMLEF